MEPNLSKRFMINEFTSNAVACTAAWRMGVMGTVGYCRNDVSVACIIPYVFFLLTVVNSSSRVLGEVGFRG